MSNLVKIIGAGGHCRAIIPLIRNKYPTASMLILDVLFDRQICQSGESIMGYAVQQIIIDDLARYHTSDALYFLAFGRVRPRELVFSELSKVGAIMPNIIAPTAIVLTSISENSGLQIMHNTYIGPNVELGRNILINTGSIVEHDSKIGSHTSIALSVTIAGRVNVGERSFIGSNSFIGENMHIEDGAKISAGKCLFNAGG